MTIDERLEFLRQSTESLHASCQELHATAAAQQDQIDALVKLTRDGFATLAEHMAGMADSLAALAATVKAHEERLNGLEGKGDA